MRPATQFLWLKQLWYYDSLILFLNVQKLFVINSHSKIFCLENISGYNALHEMQHLGMFIVPQNTKFSAEWICSPLEYNLEF